MNRTILKNLVVVVSPDAKVKVEAMKAIKDQLYAKEYNGDDGSDAFNVNDAVSSIDPVEDITGWQRYHLGLANVFDGLSHARLYGCEDKDKSSVIFTDEYCEEMLIHLNRTSSLTMKTMIKGLVHVPMPGTIIYVAPTDMSAQDKKSYTNLLYKHSSDICETIYKVNGDNLDNLKDVVNEIFS